MKTKIVLLLTVLLLSAATGFAQTSGTCGDNLTWTFDNGTLTISGIGEMTDYDIGHDVPWDSHLPSIRNVIIEYGVARIGNHAFAFCDMIHLVTIPESVTNIGVGAFLHCVGLSSITIPNSVENIGDMAFANCTSLESVIIPNSVTSIGERAFDYCISLASVTVPESVTSIENGTFSGCINLASVNIPNSVTSIGGNAFWNCSSLTSVTIGNSVTSIGQAAFSGCINLASVNIPNSVTSIEQGAFWNCSSLTSVTIGNSVESIGETAFAVCVSLTAVNIPNSVTSIGEYAFRLCTSLTAIDVDENNASYSSENGILFNKERTTLVKYPEGKTDAEYTIPNSVTSIGWDAFSGCSSLTSVTIPNSVTSIGGDAFDSCINLASVNIPNSVTSIGERAFYGCGSLKDITVNWSTPLSIDANVFSTVTTAEINLHVPAGTEALYRADAVWGGFNIPGVGQTWNLTPTMTATLVDGTLTISTTQTAENMPDYSYPDYAPWYSNNSSITTVIIEDGVTSIGNYAFYSCSSLAAVTVPESVTNIGGYAFSFCYSLTAIDVHNNNTIYASENGILFNKAKTTLIQYPIGKPDVNYAIPNGVTSIGDMAFGNCNSLVSVTLPESVISIGYGSFISCSSLASFTIPSSVTSMGDNVFFGCNSLVAIHVHENNAAYASENGVLFNKEKTVLIKYPDGKQDTNYTIPNGVTSIGHQSFSGHKKLTSVAIPESVTSMGEAVFAWCSSLEDVTVGWSIPLSIYENVFDGLTTSEITLHVPSGTEALYRADAVWGGFNIESIPNNVTGVSLDQTELSLTVDATEQLTATVLPANADNKAVTWTSSNASVATVANGLVTAIAEGAATITVTTEDGEFTATCAVTVTRNIVSVTGVSLNKTALSLTVNATEQLTATVLPANADNKAVTWTSSNASVATVANGLVTAISEGAATITVTTEDGEFTATCAVTVTRNIVSVTGVSLNKTALSLTVNATEQLTATVLPANADNKAVVWTSSNESVATVTDGLVTAITEGEATITVTTEDGEFTATCAVTVMRNPVPVTDISLDVTKLTLQKPFPDSQLTHQLTATVFPENADNKNVTWTSDNPTVVSVSQTGLLTTQPDKTGRAIITAITEDGAFSATCMVTVTDFREETNWNDNIGMLSIFSTLLTLQNDVNNGYIIITLPAGLSLSPNATRVNEAYLTLGEITQISASQWRIGLASRTLRSATENGEPELLIEIGYTASESTADGDYEAIIDTLELTFDDGTIVKEEEVPVTVNVNRAGTAIANVVKAQLMVSVRNNVLKIGGLSAGDLFNVYNMQGVLIYKGKATASEAYVNLPSRAIYIVTAGKERVKVR